jgi:8-oxo-dGTP diphosphatase
VVGALIDPAQAAQRYPHLFEEDIWAWGPMRVHFELFLDDQPPQTLIANVNLVARCGDGWLVLKLEDGSLEVPGGTLEDGESYADAMRRELREEAGAEIESFKVIGGWHCHSLAADPYRQHLPFPEFYRVVAIGHVRHVGEPTDPEYGEQVIAVECLPLREVTQRFKYQGRDDLAELYELANKFI